MDKKSPLIINTDGGSRGNPGPAAFGVVIYWPNDTKEYGEALGRATNNQAEYQGVVFALKKAKQLLGKIQAKQTVIELRTDSQLLTRQLNGEYKVLDEDIQSLFLQVWNLRLDFDRVIFKHVRREENQAADRMVNWALDHDQNQLKF